MADLINTQPKLSGPSCPCSGTSNTLDLSKVGPGGFGIINIDGSSGGTGTTNTYFGATTSQLIDNANAP